MSLRDNLANIVEYDKLLKDQSLQPVVTLSEVRYLKRSRKDQVIAIQKAPRGETGY